MSFGSSNPPWQRNSLGNAGQQNAIANLQSQMMNTNFVGFQNLAMTNQVPQNNLTLVPQLQAANINTLNNTSALFANHQTIQYQNRPGLNPNAFGPAQSGQQIMHHQAQTQSSQSQVQVQQVTAANQGHSMNMRPNTNQSQMQVQSSQQQQQQQQSTRNFTGYNAAQSQSTYANSFERTSNNSTRSSNHSSRQSPPSATRRSSPDRSSRRDEEERKRRKEREREREKEQEKREDRSPVRKISPRRRTRPIPRYMVQVPKITLNASEADILELRRRYMNLYVPSDFFYSRICWSESFPCHAPFSIKKPSAFHIFHKRVENPNGVENGAVFEPPDADDSFQAKVMLMSVPPMSEFYRKCFTSADEKERDDLLHPSRLISFLVGVLGKNETMAIGGSYSRSLDGPNPSKDPTVLIKTAIRTCKALTGIDLSPCTQWYRFVELYYTRPESVRKCRTVPARTQTVVIFLPDVRSCLPTRLEWDELSNKYKKHLETKYHSNDDVETLDADKKQSPGVKLNELTNDGGINADIEMDDESNKLEQDTHNNVGNESHDSSETAAAKATVDADTSDATPTISKGEKIESMKIEATHFSDLDVKTMKIQDLRDQLDARGISSKGLKPQLVARLSKTLKSEETESISAENQNESNVVASATQIASSEINESNDSMDIDLADIVIIDEYVLDSTKIDSKHDSASKRSSSKKVDRWLEKRYRLPENPQILCHPAQNTSMEKFTCEVRSLSILLDYRPEDTKKTCFEVSLFAELFNEMLMRDFGFNIYKVLHTMPEQEQAEHESKEKRDKSVEDEPKEKRHRKVNEKSSESKLSKKDDSSGATSHDKTKSETDKDSKNSKDARSREKEKEKSSRRREEDSDDERSVDGKKRDTKKMITIDPELLLSFVYFDQTNCGYIFSNHLEELFYSLGLRLSRTDAKKIINKVAPRSLFYRKLTDKPKDEPTTNIPSVSVENLEELGKGNNFLLPFIDNSAPIEKSEKIESENVEQISEPSTAESHMVMHKGALIDIEKLLKQLNRSEKAREETEHSLTELTRTYTELQSSNSKAKDKIKDLQSELKSSNRKMGDTENSLSTINKKCADYYSILCGIHDKLGPIFNKSERGSSKKESSNRDKDRRDRDKDRNNGTSANKEKDVKESKAETKSEIIQEKPEKSDKQEEN
ncbi:cell division cycle and apoptosis regulator protein 1-like isoform X2 [Contarinia nasturtii]|uniref:cell division cycle and apoptosis regulator protein 1-like isoform X2 n=1 Tax=Contarinia nasturtii TaxID=265458 RepID=UPI0012D38B05|nr:cell division cycle and apoptosis regulator protein 1-like isoform X2 [Contarinia nasturtii]